MEVVVTDFRSWLMSNVDGSAPEEVRCLYTAVRDGLSTEDSPWKIRRAGARIFIRSWSGDRLEILSPKAASTFLTIMDEMFGQDMDVETWADYERALARDKS